MKAEEYCRYDALGLADLVRVSANVETFAAENAEVDVWQRDFVDAVAIDVNKTRFAFDHFSLAGQLIKGHAAVFLGRYHRRHLIEVALEFLKSSVDF